MEEETAPISSGENIKRILIIDDDPQLLELLGKALKAEGVEVITTTEIEGAEYALKSAFIDVVLADIRVTGVLGHEALKILTYASEKSPKTKVIIMTRNGSAGIEKEAYDKGAYFYFVKPIDLCILKEKLNHLGVFSRAPIRGARP